MEQANQNPLLETSRLFANVLADQFDTMDSLLLDQIVTVFFFFTVHGQRPRLRRRRTP